MEAWINLQCNVNAFLCLCPLPMPGNYAHWCHRAHAIWWYFISLLVPPSFISLPTNKTTVKGSSVTFQCIATGFPIPIVSWYFKGHHLSTNSKYIVGSTSVTVNNADANDAGWYMCTISNSAGLKNSTAYLDIQGIVCSPRFTICQWRLNLRFSQGFLPVKSFTYYIYTFHYLYQILIKK